jgi:phosphonate transport system substrate-binding protein
MMMFLMGCGPGPDTAVIDFTETGSAERPDIEESVLPHLRVAIAAMVSPKETFGQYRQILDYIGKALEREIELIQRKTYGEINALFRKGKIDLAFVCSGPYATGKDQYGFDALAVPQVRGQVFYQSYLIVNRDSAFRTLESLKDKIFAFTDPGSNTGSLVPTFWVNKMGESPRSFFKQVIYTYGHDNSILAVARSMVDGAAIDGHIWEYYSRTDPTHTSRTRILKKSELFGNPPLVASKHLSARQKDRIQEILFAMHLNPRGKQILDKLMIDQFKAPKEVWYDGIRQMDQYVYQKENRENAISES